VYRLYRFLSSGLERLLVWKFPERFGDPPGFSVDLWMHAASVGEAQVAAAILKELKKKRPEVSVLLTLQTPTGLKRAEELLAEEEVSFWLAPWDGPQIIKAFLENLKPRVLALIETELWPNLLQEALRRGIRVVILNGRLSPKAFPRYRLLRPLLAPLLKEVAFLGAISSEDRQRFVQLGVPEERTAVEGNAKHDLLFKRAQQLCYQELQALVQRLGLEPQEKVVVLGSFRGGEEKVALEILKALKDFPQTKFIVVPRHPEKAPQFYRVLAPLGLPVAFFRKAVGLQGFRVVIVDEVGPLFKLYALSEMAVIGGSFVPRGGQNPIEPAVLGKPVVFGAHMENFPLESKILLDSGGAYQVSSPGEAALVLRKWLLSPAEASHTGLKAFQAARKLRGAAKRYAEVLQQFL